MKSLSVGNVVSAGLRIYRDHFKEYFRLAFIGYLWILVPVYGWAKLAATMGLISRLAFGEVNEKPESTRDAQRYIKPRMWKFLVAGILVFFIFIGACIAVLLGILIVSFGVRLIFGNITGTTGGISVVSTIIGIVAVIAFILLIIGYIWLISRLFMVELPLGIEENVNATEAISRSWELTKDSVFRIQKIVFISFLISLPITGVVQIASFVLQGVLESIYPADSAMFGFLYVITLFVLTVGSSALMVPFWQSIKAVIYYDLRVRREGFGMEMRDE